MSEKTQHKNILLTVAAFTVVVVIIAVIGTLVFKSEPEIIQGYVEVSEYRVSSKVPGRVLELRVKEGDYVNVGDTLAIIDAPDVKAKLTQAESAESAASAMALTPCFSRQRPDWKLRRNRITACSVSTTRA